MRWLLSQNLSNFLSLPNNQSCFGKHFSHFSKLNPIWTDAYWSQYQSQIDFMHFNQNALCFFHWHEM